MYHVDKKCNTKWEEGARNVGLGAHGDFHGDRASLFVSCVPALP